MHFEIQVTPPNGNDGRAICFDDRDGLHSSRSGRFDRFVSSDYAVVTVYNDRAAGRVFFKRLA
jgi:hypothetical protein